MAHDGRDRRVPRRPRAWVLPLRGRPLDLSVEDAGPGDERGAGRGGDRMKVDRRDFLKGATAGGALAAFGLGYGPVVARMFSGTSGSPNEPDPVVGPEGYLYSSCLQCNTGCGIKVKVVDGKAVKIEGNPYSPFNRFPHLAYGTGAVAAANEFGALCPKGQAGLQTAYDPYRIRKVFKRAGPRGSNRWITIPFDQAIQEIADGGTLFADVPGKAGRREFIDFFIKDGLGSTNYHGHTTVCQGSLYFASKAMSDQWDAGKWQLGQKFYWQADLGAAEVVIFVGGDPFEGDYGPTNRSLRIADGLAS